MPKDSILNFIYQNPVLKVVYELAHEAHYGTFRKGKRAGQEAPPPYIEHPLKVFEVLLKTQKEFDIVKLAASLLHDVIEDTEFDTPEKLEAELIKRGVDKSLAAEIAEVTSELTNAHEMLEGKRTWQVDHIRHATPRAKEIKIADQVANLIDIIELPSEKITVAYANKARDVYKSASAINPVLDETFKLIYGTVRNVLENVPLANRSLLSVDIDSLIALGRVNVNSKEKTPTAGSTAEKYISEQDYKNKATGVVAVGLDKNHDVVSYTIIVNPQGSEKTEANSSAEKLRAGIEKLSRRRVTTGVLTEDFGDDIALRVNYIKPSVNLDEFIKQAGSLISNELETTLNNSKQR